MLNFTLRGFIPVGSQSEALKVDVVGGGGELLTKRKRGIRGEGKFTLLGTSWIGVLNS